MLQGAELEPTPSIPISGWLESTDDDFISEFCWFIPSSLVAPWFRHIYYFRRKEQREGWREKERKHIVYRSLYLRFLLSQIAPLPMEFSRQEYWLLLLLSRFSRVWLCATPQTAAHQAPPSLGFSRQEHWSGLPFPSPMRGSEKWKWSCSVVSDSLWPHGLQPTRLLHPWDFPGKSTGVGCPCLFWRILEWEAISFSRGFSWTWESNPGLLHCEQILYHLSHQGSPILFLYSYVFSFLRFILYFRVIVQIRKKKTYGYQKEKVWERDKLGVWDQHIHPTIFKKDKPQRNLLYSTGNSTWYSVIT